MIAASLAIWHVSLIEIIWTVIGLVGMYLGYKNLGWSRKSIENLEATNGRTLAKYRTMRVIAYGHFRNDLFRFSKHTTIAVVGVISMLLPSTATCGSTHITFTQVLLTGSFFTISVLLVLASALDRKQREALEQDDL